MAVRKKSADKSKKKTSVVKKKKTALKSKSPVNKLNKKKAVKNLKTNIKKKSTAKNVKSDKQNEAQTPSVKITFTSAKKNYVFIVNPSAGGGRCARKWPVIETEILRKFDDVTVIQTESSGHATEIARKAVLKQVKAVIAVGGDGTISEVASGFFSADGKILNNSAGKLPILGIIASGSGSDLIKTLRIPRDPLRALDVIHAGSSSLMDLGIVKFTTADGRRKIRPFINIADIGIGGEVIEILEQQGKSFWPTFSYMKASIKGLLRYQDKQMEIRLDSGREIKGIISGVIVANGKYFGSGMQIAPHADPSDGFFDIVIIHGGSKLRMILSMARVRSGKHIYMPEVEVVRARKVGVTSVEKGYLDLDGEMPGYAPAEFEIIPSAIRTFMPARIN